MISLNAFFSYTGPTWTNVSLKDILACFFIESFLYSGQSSCFRSSEKAIAAYFAMADMLRLKVDRRRLARYMEADFETVDKLVKEMLLAVSYNTQNKLNWVVNKYKNDTYVEKKVKGRYSLVKNY